MRGATSFVPKLFTLLRLGYSAQDLKQDVIAGLTVAVVALPLAMALAIASGTTPEKGLHTAIVAGFLISLLGGSRVQIGGPTAAFIPVVFGVIHQFGYEGLILCTLLAGLILIVAGALRLGTLMKYMPTPVITGFTIGIAVSIAWSQVKDFLGLPIAQLPAEFTARWSVYAAHLGQTNHYAAMLGAASIAAILALRKWKPGWPAFLMVVAAMSGFALLLGLPADTIATRFGKIPASLPSFSFPHIPFERTLEMLPAALTIAFLAGVESLLSAVVADGMIGGRHRSNAELVAQGVANAASALCGGLPATGAIARTATNVRAGAKSPLSGIFHALFLMAFMLLLAPLMRYIPLAVLAAVLLVVAWNMLEIDHVKHLMKGPIGDRAVLLATFALTVLFDLTVAIEVGVVLAAFLFMHRMAGVVGIDAEKEGQAPETDYQRRALAPGVEAYRFSGPLFFAVANRLDYLLDQLMLKKPAAIVLRMSAVPLIDASGAQALAQFLERAGRHGLRVVFSGLQNQPKEILQSMGVLAHGAVSGSANDFAEAATLANRIAEESQARR